MNNNPTTAASMELVKALEELTRVTGVRVDLLPLHSEPRPKYPKLVIVQEPLRFEDDDDGA